MSFVKNILSGVSDSIGNGIKTLAPFAVGIAIELGFEDQRIGKIVGGAIVAFSGLNIISKSLHSWKWRAQTEPNSTLQKISRYGTLTLGLGFASYGIYSIIHGIKELLFPLSCEMKLENAKKQLLSCPEARKLWQEVSNEGPITCRCAKNEELAPSDARVRLDLREISISESCNDPEISLLFELQNLKNSNKFVDHVRQRCSLNVEEYAHSMESLEYETSTITHQISKQCVQEGYWPKSMVAFDKQYSGPDETNWNTLETYLADQDRLGHTDIYRQNWYEKCDRPK